MKSCAKKSGENGFGYDPIFYVPTHKKASAELSAEQKNTISHRGKALQALLARAKKIKPRMLSSCQPLSLYIHYPMVCEKMPLL